MKLPCLPILTLLGAMWSGAGAFTLDAVGYDGGDFERSPLSLRLPGYGAVVFETGEGMPLVVNPAYCSVEDSFGVPTRLESHESVKISLGNVQADRDKEPSSELVVVGRGQAEPAASKPRDWTSIPEPASAALGLIGVLLYLISRRR